ncbi:hypothetical protein ACFT9I_16570 [Streptomyces sp. NPDC057137]|uniref:hypothetical protein n=1 Tax=Streptomyces sp. NPDC057137 TaxID=3346030 RepID=UPI003637AA08
MSYERLPVTRTDSQMLVLHAAVLGSDSARAMARLAELTPWPDALPPGRRSAGRYLSCGT